MELICKPQKAVVTSLVFRVSLDGGDCSPSGDQFARLLTYIIKIWNEIQ